MRSNSSLLILFRYNTIDSNPSKYIVVQGNGYKTTSKTNQQ